jgi:hypothetical protein
MTGRASQVTSNAELLSWFKQEVDERARAGGNTKPWHAFATDPRTAQVWQVIGDWPQDTAIRWLRLALGFAEDALIGDLDDLSEVTSPVHRIAQAARTLVAELNGDPDMAEALLGASSLFVGQLETLADRAQRNAELIETGLRRLAPGVSRKVSHDRKKLAYRGFIASTVAEMRHKGIIDLNLSKQHRLVATLTNIVFGGGEVTTGAEERRWSRQER